MLCCTPMHKRLRAVRQLCNDPFLSNLVWSATSCMQQCASKACMAVRRYSFILSAAVGFVFAFQFVLMCPQLYLNYKLKSVAHLPWRQMTYKFLNTIVDDFGAFIIKAPFLYRLAVFRDDVVFLIYIYQRWIYRVDTSRVNEFGFSDKAPEQPAEQQGELTQAASEGNSNANVLAELAGREQTQLSGRRRDATKQVRPNEHNVVAVRLAHAVVCIVF